METSFTDDNGKGGEGVDGSKHLKDGWLTHELVQRNRQVQCYDL